MVHKNFPAVLDSLYEMLEFITSYSQKRNLAEKTQSNIVLAAEEVLVNIITYGYPENKKGEIEINCEKTSSRDGIKIVIKDKGVPFNPIENIPSSRVSEATINQLNSESLGGFGIYIFIGLMDKVEYERQEDGNKLTLIKYL